MYRKSKACTLNDPPVHVRNGGMDGERVVARQIFVNLYGLLSNFNFCSLHSRLLRSRALTERGAPLASMAASMLRRASSNLDLVFSRPFLPFLSETSTLAAPSVPSFSFGASMELMAVPKKKVSPYKKGLRNGPKALKPVPVIVRCQSCGRVKLPHFYCCSGNREQGGSSPSS
ncbi:hypothetical protein HPP92_001122 [Vanilla planifolia]|uniref:Large ribosomal subunit protein bL32m n=1 Tax=Vanilla planifolia TaxID=51239 RepID=A0A835RYQ3_VANPL|nr:hypothetical protein HPP92_001122 [Vanilla planifolia]